MAWVRRGKKNPAGMGCPDACVPAQSYMAALNLFAHAVQTRSVLLQQGECDVLWPFSTNERGP